MMRAIFPLVAVIALAAGCKEQTGPVESPTYRITATVTEDNKCTVNALGKSYSSIGQVRGDVPSKFVGTLSDKTYHGFGCWVAADQGDGDLIVLFSGNNFGKPLKAGTYPLKLELLDDTPPNFASVNFRPSEFGADRLRTRDGAVGSVTVTETPAGGRTITVDVEAVRWGPIF